MTDNVHESFDDEPEGLDIDQFLHYAGTTNLDEVSHTSTQPGEAQGSAQTVTGDLSFPLSLQLTAEDSTYSTATPVTRNYLWIDGKKYMKDFIVAAFLCSGRSRKVTMRTLRARGLTIEDLCGKHNWDTANFLNKDQVKCTDVAATLVHHDTSICLAVGEIIAFETNKDKSHRLTTVSYEELERLDADISVIVQLLELVQSVSETGAATDTWEWTRQYIHLSDGIKTTSAERAAHKDLSFALPGFLIHPLGPTLKEYHQQGKAPSLGSKLPLMWSFSGDDLHEIMSVAWEALSPDSDDIVVNLDMIPSIGTVSIPYKDTDGMCYIYH